MGIFQRVRDAAAVRRVLTGDPDAFRTIVSAYGGAVQWVAYAHLGNREEAEEVCQETFLKAFQSLHSLREISQLGHWLLSIARNLSRDVLRKRAREAESISQSAAPDAVHPQPDRMEVHERVRAHLNALDDEDREVLVLCYFEGCRAPEIADLLGISRAAARKRLQRARQVLGKRLVRELGDDIARTKPCRPNTEKYMALVLAAPIPIRPDIASSVAKTGGIIMAAASKKVAIGAFVGALLLVGVPLCVAPLGAFRDRIFKNEPVVVTHIPLKFTPGETYRLTEKYSFSDKLDGKPDRGRWEIALDIHIDDVDPQGDTKATVSYQTITHNVDTPLDDASAAAMSKVLLSFRGIKPLRLPCTISLNGTVDNLQGLDEIEAAVTQAIQEATQGADPSLRRFIEDLPERKWVSPQWVQSWIVGVLRRLPERTVRVGEPWSENGKATYFGPDGPASLLESTWTFKKARPDVIVMVGSMKATPDLADSAANTGELSGTATTRAEFDRTTGLLKAWITTSKVSGTVPDPERKGQLTKLTKKSEDIVTVTMLD